MIKKEAYAILQYVRKDFENGVKISSAEQALIMFALLLAEAYDECQMAAEDQAEWELKNNPMQPGARLACEKISKAFELMGTAERANQLADQGGERGTKK